MAIALAKTDPELAAQLEKMIATAPPVKFSEQAQPGAISLGHLPGNEYWEALSFLERNSKRKYKNLDNAAGAVVAHIQQTRKRATEASGAA
jgi:hypothetical protein